MIPFIFYKIWKKEEKVQPIKKKELKFDDLIRSVERNNQELIESNDFFDFEHISPFNLPLNVFEVIYKNLSTKDLLSGILVSKFWANKLSQILYFSPPLLAPLSFARLNKTLINRKNYLHYLLFVKKLDLKGVVAQDLEMGDLDCALSYCINLEHFRLENCLHISNILISSLAECCTSLKTVELPGCPMITDRFIPKLATECPEIEKIDLSGTNVSLQSLPVLLEHCLKLKSLNLSNVKSVELKNNLNADGEEEFETQTYDPTLDLTPSYKSEILELIAGGTDINDTLTKYISIHCSNLKKLNLDSSVNLTDSGFTEKLVQNLEELSVSNCAALTDLTLQTISIFNKKLNFINFSVNKNVTSNGVQFLFKSVETLKVALFHGCPRINNSILKNVKVKEELPAKQSFGLGDDDMEEEEESEIPCWFDLNGIKLVRSGAAVTSVFSEKNENLFRQNNLDKKFKRFSL
ncbi:hypothetical protein HDU92_005417 [Lobulomyces angularis]|nr:hypothetical protein HDU92_005417 [Lobulomyces angularis]